MPIERNDNGLTFADWIYDTHLWESYRSRTMHDSSRDAAVKAWRNNEDPVTWSSKRKLQPKLGGAFCHTKQN